MSQDAEPYEVVDPERAAWASIRGYYYQALRSVLRWLSLDDGEMIVCEGNEDIDRILRNGTAESEQVKYRAARLGASKIRKIVCDFMRTHLALQHRAERRTYRLTTNSAQARWTENGVDILESWSNNTGGKNELSRVATQVRESLERHNDCAESARALSEMGDEAWHQFVSLVSWTFEAPDLEGTRILIADALQGRCAADPHHVRLITDRMLCAILDASIERDPANRTLDKAALDDLLALSTAELTAWTTSREHVEFRPELYIERELSMPIRERHGATAPSVLLSASYQVVKFCEAGRVPDLQHLAEWCSSDHRIAIELWTGDGGVGKTRLLTEWCQRLDTQGWHAGFLVEASPEFLGALDVAGAPTLVVIDYADTRAEQVHEILRHLGRRVHSPAARKLRIALLARHAGAWWQRLRHRDGDLEHCTTVLCRPTERQLNTSELAPDARWEIYDAATTAYREALGSDAEIISHDIDLADSAFDRPLYVQIAALVAITTILPNTTRLLLDTVLTREKAGWERELRSRGVPIDEVDALARTMAAVTLCGIDVGERRALELSAAVNSGIDETTQRRLWHVLRRLYPSSEEGGHVRPVTPDLLGERLIHAVLESSDEFVPAMIEALSPGSGSANMVATLTRIAETHTDSSTPVFQVVSHWLEGYPSVPAQISSALANAFSSETALAVRDRIAIARQTLSALSQSQAASVDSGALDIALVSVQVLFEGSTTDEDDALILSARSLLSDSLEQVGRYRDKLALADLSLACLDRSATVDVNHTLERALVLEDSGLCLSKLGRWGDSIEDLREARSIFEVLNRNYPDPDFARALATATHNLAISLENSGDLEDALETESDAVAIRRGLVAAGNGDDVLPELADSLMTLGICFGRSGRVTDALHTLREACDISIEVSERDGRSPSAQVARSSGSFATSQRLAGDLLGSLESQTRSTNTWRELARSSPLFFRDSYARSLNNLAVCLVHVGEISSALDRVVESVQILRQILEENPFPYSVDLAQSLSTSANLHSLVGRHEDATRAAIDATVLYWKAAATGQMFLEDRVASSIYNLAVIRQAHMSLQDAEHYALESCVLSQQLARENPDRFQDVFVKCRALAQVLVESRSVVPRGQSLDERLQYHESLGSSTLERLHGTALGESMLHTDS